MFDVECPNCQSTKAILAYEHPWCYFCPSCRHVWDISLTPTEQDAAWSSSTDTASPPGVDRDPSTFIYQAIVAVRAGGDRRQPGNDRRHAYRRRTDRQQLG
jgi:hypothetical protein